METLLIMLMLPLPFLVGRAQDPSVLHSREEARNLECVRMTQAQAHELHPGRVPEPAARQTPGATFDALACTRRMVEYGERPDRDELILSTLRRSVGEITEVATALGPESLTWHVDAFYPDPRVASKISVAARTDLAERGRKVSDRVPVLAAGDLSVLSTMGPREAYAVACKRYFAQHVLDVDDAFLALMIVDARETQLHAGVCIGGDWRWLR